MNQKHSLLIYDHMRFKQIYLNFQDHCRSQYTAQYESITSYSLYIYILKEKYNAWIRTEYNSLFAVERYLVFDTEEDKLEFVLTYS